MKRVGLGVALAACAAVEAAEPAAVAPVQTARLPLPLRRPLARLLPPSRIRNPRSGSHSICALAMCAST